MCFTNRQIDNRCKKIMDIAEQIKALEAAADALKNEIKADMEAGGLDEIETGKYTVRYKSVTSNRLDSTALKKALPDVYSMYTKSTTTKRFTVA